MVARKVLAGFAVLALGAAIMVPVATAFPPCGRKACSEEVAASGLSGQARRDCFKQVIADCNAVACSCTGGSPPCSCPTTSTTTTSTTSSTTPTCPATTPNFCPATGECLAPCAPGSTFKPTTCACEGTSCNWTCSSGIAGCQDMESLCSDYCFALCGDYCHSIGDDCAVAACEPACEDNLCNGRCSGDPSGVCVRLSNCTDACTTAACDSACSARGLTCAFPPSCGPGCNR